MNVESVIVSVDYGDYLRFTLPLNKGHFNRTVVVTSSRDRETKNICAYYDVECVVSDDMFTNGKFNKGKAINLGLAKLAFKGWVVHLDADIVLPPRTRSILSTLSLNEQFLYGMDRMMCPTYEAWEKFAGEPVSQHNQAYVYAGPFPLGFRLFRKDAAGVIPLGYFQLFHRAANCLRESPVYPEDYESAATSDLLFSCKWPRTHRHWLPEIICTHLGTDDMDTIGVNWEGRKTKRFGPKDNLALMYRPSPAQENSK